MVTSVSLYSAIRGLPCTLEVTSVSLCSAIRGFLGQ